MLKISPGLKCCKGLSIFASVAESMIFCTSLCILLTTLIRLAIFPCIGGTLVTETIELFDLGLFLLEGMTPALSLMAFVVGVEPLVFDALGFRTLPPYGTFDVLLCTAT